MTDAREERLKRLAGRFQTHAGGRPAAPKPRARDRTSLYLDRELMARVNTTYKEVSHKRGPQSELAKAVFLEALIEYGLNHLPEVEQSILDGQESQDGQVPS